MDTYKLTEYSHGAGCGCKLSPGVLAEIITGETGEVFPGLLVGNETRDDAAVFDLDGTTAIVSTTDFFMPIVDDPFDFGAIAATNALSDIYAMGAQPLMAIAILGWPINKIPASVAGTVIQGARSVCSSAGIPLAGGHSIDSPEPIFGLAVTGKTTVNQIKRNGDARQGDMLYLTKPIGIGTVTTAQKKKLADKKDLDEARSSMLKLNTMGAELGAWDFVNAVTDVTGFGLAGHLIEMCEAADLSATLYLDQVPVFGFVKKYLDLDCIPGGTHRNWLNYESKCLFSGDETYKILADPQTSGGLLISVDASRFKDFEKAALGNGLVLSPIGEMRAKGKHVVTVL